MRRALALSIAALSLLQYSSFAAEDLTALARPVVRGGAANSQIYFVMTDRFANGDINNDEAGLTGFSATTGYDPTDIGYFHGGDLKGLTAKLDYIQSLGFNSIWITPPVTQRYVQGSSAAYHGYWGLDFTKIDPHLGTEADFKELVSQAHKLGIKVIVDIVVNHTADVIKYDDGNYNYVDLADRPYRDCSGRSFDFAKYVGKSNFPNLCVAKSFPKIPVISSKDAKVKAPAFLNDLTNYHNRGNSTFTGESTTLGDFYGLDDIFTEKPEVVKGWTKNWQDWITRFDIDGYRIDTAKHVNPDFWKVFLPAILKSAKAAGKQEFPIYGEVWDTDPAFLSTYVTDYQFPGILDFAFQAAAAKFATYGQGEQTFLDIFNQDDLYLTSKSSAYGLTTFLDNHDMGRIGYFLQRNSNATESQLLERDKLAHALLFLLRGGPTVYYGDEKGMVGSGGDKLARQDMFATKVIDWQQEARIGGSPIGSQSAFDITNPLEQTIKQLQQLTLQNPALRSGTQQLRYARDGAFAVSRYANQQEFLVAFNGRDGDATLQLPVSTNGSKWLLISGRADQVTSSGSSVGLILPARSWVVLKAETRFTPATKLAISLEQPFVDYRINRTYLTLSANVPGDDFNEITFAVRAKGGKWSILGTSDKRTFGDPALKDGRYRVFLHQMNYQKGTKLELVAIARSATGEKVASKLRTISIK